MIKKTEIITYLSIFIVYFRRVNVQNSATPSDPQPPLTGHSRELPLIEYPRGNPSTHNLEKLRILDAKLDTNEMLDARLDAD